MDKALLLEESNSPELLLLAAEPPNSLGLSVLPPKMFELHSVLAPKMLLVPSDFPPNILPPPVLPPKEKGDCVAAAAPSLLVFGVPNKVDAVVELPPKRFLAAPLPEPKMIQLIKCYKFYYNKNRYDQ